MFVGSLLRQDDSDSSTIFSNSSGEDDDEDVQYFEEPGGIIDIPKKTAPRKKTSQKKKKTLPVPHGGLAGLADEEYQASLAVKMGGGGEKVGGGGKVGDSTGFVTLFVANSLTQVLRFVHDVPVCALTGLNQWYVETNQEENIGAPFEAVVVGRVHRKILKDMPLPKSVDPKSLSWRLKTHKVGADGQRISISKAIRCDQFGRVSTRLIEQFEDDSVANSAPVNGTTNIFFGFDTNHIGIDIESPEFLTFCLPTVVPPK